MDGMPSTIFNYIGTFLVGGTVALMLYAVIKSFKLAVPSWVYPAAIGGSMLAFQVYNDYTWFGRTASGLPPTHVVAGTFTGASPLKFWTYVVPTIDRFSVVDVGSAKRNPAVPDLVIADVVFVTRFQPTVVAPQIFDCAGNRRADGHSGVTFGPDGRPENANWVAVEPGDAMFAITCGAENAPAASG